MKSTQKSQRLLIVSDNPENIRAHLAADYTEVTGFTADDLAGGERPEGVSLIITDLASDKELARLRLILPDPALLVLTRGDAGQTEDLASEDATIVELYCGDPAAPSFAAMVKRLLTMQQMRCELLNLQQTVAMNYGFDNLVGISESIRKLKEAVRKVAPTDISVLLSGPSGCGKELAARVMHHHSRHRKGPFVAVDFSALPEALIETVLFGQKDGEPGLLAQADGGSLFLSEVSRVPAAVQPRLAAFLQNLNLAEADVPGGGKLDLRVIAATSEDLSDLVQKGNYDKSLAARLNVIQLAILPLRERMEDLEILTEHFLRQLAGEDNRRTLRINRAAVDRLMNHRWPGNVQELENCLRRAAALCHESELMAEDITFVGTASSVAVENAPAAPLPRNGRARLLDDGQRTMIVNALRDNDWNFTQTAQELGIGRTTLWRKVKKYKLKRGEEIAEGYQPETVGEPK